MEKDSTIAVLEDQVSIARPWLAAIRRRRHEMEAPDENLITGANEAFEWVEANHRRRWILVVDIDIEGDELRPPLNVAAHELAKEHPGLGNFSGAVLLHHLQHHFTGAATVKNHILVVTGQIHGELQRWLRDTGINVLSKPVFAEEVRDALPNLLKVTHPGEEVENDGRS